MRHTVSPIGFYSRSDLKLRGWSPGLIKTYLGQPAKTVPNPHNPYSHGMALYDAAEVHEIESLYSLIEDSASYQSRNYQTLARNKIYTEALLSTLTASFVAPVPPSRVAAESLARGMVGKLCGMGIHVSSVQFDRLVALAMLQEMDHALGHVDELFGMNGIQVIRAELRKKLLDKVSESHSDLAYQCRIIGQSRSLGAPLLDLEKLMSW